MEHLLIEWPVKGVCVLRLNRPEVYNALSVGLVTDLRAALPAILCEGARVAVLAAASPGFCAGADLKERRSMDDAAKYRHNRAIFSLANEIAALPIPTIAAINGIAMGGGVELPLACDLRYAAQGSRLALSEAKLGAIPGAGGTQRLARLVGISRAMEIMLTGEAIDESRAELIGLVNAVIPGDSFEDQVIELAGAIAAKSSMSSRLLKEVVYKGMEGPLDHGLLLETNAIAGILKSDDYKEGLAAFAERRAPNFS